MSWPIDTDSDLAAGGPQAAGTSYKPPNHRAATFLLPFHPPRLANPRVALARIFRRPAMSVAAGVSDAAMAVRDKLRGRIGQTKVKRYWPGKAPEWADEPGGDDLDLPACRAVLHHALPRHDDGIGVGVSGHDRRLRCLAETRAENREEARADHRRVVRQGEVASTAEERYGEDDEAQEERRRWIRERQLLEREDEEEEEELVAADVSEDESEYGINSGDECMFVALVKPIFIQKTQRITIAERKRMEEVARQFEEVLVKRTEERKIETRQIVVEEIRKELQINKIQSDIEIEDVLTDDEENKAEEYEAWAYREIARIKRVGRKERRGMRFRRNMTEEERREWERMNPKLLKQPKQKQRFMQKYYHKGSFFQEKADDVIQTIGSDDIYKHDFSAPTGEDRMVKSILPKVMQVKHFGLKGRMKWRIDGPLRARYNAKMAGMNAPVAKPKGSKKIKDWMRYHGKSGHHPNTTWLCNRAQQTGHSRTSWPLKPIELVVAIVVQDKTDCLYVCGSFIQKTQWDTIMKRRRMEEVVGPLEELPKKRMEERVLRRGRLWCRRSGKRSASIRFGGAQMGLNINNLCCIACSTFTISVPVMPIVNAR
uniref:Micro-fibrillar-associated protein 1 C-terminal domain-containing protein n=1 Tax=Oryza punctata TaxID=4537 RepID=A0A0E0LB96_ORYPU